MTRRTILVTAGPTREYFDTVRFITNPSSGKMGYAIAAEAHQRGHRVVLVSGPVSLPKPPGVEFVAVSSADEMFDASVHAFEQCDAAVMTAAVCDYRPARRLAQKIKKRAADRVIRLVPTRDIAAYLGARKEHRVVIGFAMEDHDHHRHAERKLRGKKCDAIVLNGPENVAADRATIEILQTDGSWTRPQRGSKARIAAIVLELAERLVDGRK